MIMRKCLPVLMLAFSLLMQVALAAGVGDKSAVYIGGTVSDFKASTDPVLGTILLDDDRSFVFIHGKTNLKKLAILYSQFRDIEYGQKVGRRARTAGVMTALIGPAGLLYLVNERQNHFLTIGYKDSEEKDKVAVFEIRKDTVRSTLAILETRSGKKIEYQDKAGEKSGKSEN
jgi:hypothetical protein